MAKVIKLFNEDGGVNMFTINDVAKAFLSFDSMSPKKLQKLCYYAQALYLALNNERLIDCEFQAWIHGPVCPQLYSKYKHYGFSNIPKQEMPNLIDNDEYVKEFLETIYAGFGDMSADELENLTHGEDPWIEAREGFDEMESSTNIINEDSMRKYYYDLYVED